MTPTHLALAAVAALAAAGAARRGSPARRRRYSTSRVRRSLPRMTSEERQIRRLWLNGEHREQARELADTLEVRLVLAGVDLALTDLYGADLSGADLSKAVLVEANLGGAEYNEHTQWPDNFDPEEHGAILE